MKNSYSQADGNFGITSADIQNKARSWGVGPRIGIDMNWGIGRGFSLYGIGGGDLLYTRYTNLSLDQQGFLSGLPIFSYSYHINQLNRDYVRTHMDLEIGFGWGTYSFCDKWHFDLRAGYSFETYFSQNMIRVYDESLSVAKSVSSNGDLYLHGLKLKARIDF